MAPQTAALDPWDPRVQKVASAFQVIKVSGGLRGPNVDPREPEGTMGSPDSMAPQVRPE